MMKWHLGLLGKKNRSGGAALMSIALGPLNKTAIFKKAL